MIIAQSVITICSIICFIVGLKRQSKLESAKQGNLISAFGMFLAVSLALFNAPLEHAALLIVALVLGTAIGLLTAKKIAMTKMPELVALFNGFGGLASFLVGFHIAINPPTELLGISSLSITIIIGSLTFTGSIIAWLKLSEIFSAKLKGFFIINALNTLIILSIICLTTLIVLNPSQLSFYIILASLSLILGVSSVLPIGGGDMPVIIALLNSLSGLAASAAGFSLSNPILIVAGTLVGASGLILTIIMCKSMNRPLKSVLFSSFAAQSTSSKKQSGDVKSLATQDAYYALEAARKIAIIPGYGLAVAQAQHTLKDLMNKLTENGCEVRFGIHPVAGRMPGHMNVLLAEAQIEPDFLDEMESINEFLNIADICIVIGANDVVNPDALDNESSSIYGMPIIKAYNAKTVFVLKRSMKPGFAGIENPLFYKENTRMIFGDAKVTLNELVKEFE